MKNFVSIIAIVCGGLYAQLSVAIPGFWNESAYAIECKNTSVSDVLSDFSSSFNINLVVSGKISGECHGWKRAETVITFLDDISSEYQLQWFYYKNKLYISSNNDHRTLRIEAATGFKNALKGLGLFQEKFGWGELEDRGVVIVSGPSQYVNFINRLSEKEKELQEQAANSDIYVFPLKHASVADRTLKIRNEDVVIPGVASILKGLLEDKKAKVRP